MTTPPIIPPRKNKHGQFKEEQWVRNSEVEVQRIEKHREILEDAGIYSLIRIDRYLSMEQAKIICTNIDRVTWSNDTIYGTYHDKVYSFPNHHWCSMFGLDSTLPVHADYLVQDITHKQMSEFLDEKLSSMARCRMRLLSGP